MTSPEDFMDERPERVAPLVDCRVYAKNGRELNSHSSCRVYMPQDSPVLCVVCESGAEYTYVLENISCWRTYPHIPS